MEDNIGLKLYIPIQCKLTITSLGNNSKTAFEFKQRLQSLAHELMIVPDHKTDWMGHWSFRFSGRGR